MTKKHVDVAIIGAGTAGMTAYREAAKVTDSIALIEGGEYGTTCARVGCMPSKLLIAAAEAASCGIHAKPFGISYERPKIDGQAVMRRVKSERDRFVSFAKDVINNWDAADHIHAYAHFLNDHELSLSDGTTLRAEKIVIATGSRNNVLKPFQVFGDRLIQNQDVFEWDDLPSSVVVFGAGAIGLELAQALSRLGVRVRLFGRDNFVGPLTDDAVKSAAQTGLKSEFPFHPHGEVLNMANTDNGAQVTYQDEGETKTEYFEYALVATGRLPNVDKLQLHNTSMVLDASGVPECSLRTGQTSVSHIFIAGDAANFIPLLHEAAREGKVAGYNAGHYPDIRAFSKPSPLSVVFTDPQIMMVGESHADLLKRDADFAVGEVDWSSQGRSRVMLINKGLLRVYGARATGRFLGAEMFGPRAEHIAHLLAWAHQSNLTVSEMLARPFYHPVIEEGVRTALRDLNANLAMGASSPLHCIDCGVGG